MNNTLTPVQGCLIKLDVNGELGYGIVSQIKNEETDIFGSIINKFCIKII